MICLKVLTRFLKKIWGGVRNEKQLLPGIVLRRLQCSSPVRFFTRVFCIVCQKPPFLQPGKYLRYASVEMVEWME